MKSTIVFALLVAGISAFPNLPKSIGSQIDFKNERLVTGQIEDAIKEVIQTIQNAGLDPLHIESQSLSAALPVPILFSIEAIIENLMSNGLSNIVIQNLNFSLITYRLTFDIRLPQIETSVEKSAVDIVFFGKDFSSSASGRLAINNIRLNGNVRVSVGIITGVSLRSLDINFSLGGIESDLNVVVQNWDLSNWLNTYLGTTIPNTLNEFSSEINELIEIIATQVIEAIL